MARQHKELALQQAQQAQQALQHAQELAQLALQRESEQVFCGRRVRLQRRRDAVNGAPELGQVVQRLQQAVHVACVALVAQPQVGGTRRVRGQQ